VGANSALAQELPTGAFVFMDKSLIDGVGYLIFYFLMVVAVGYAYLALLSDFQAQSRLTKVLMQVSYSSGFTSES
jgi:hypothetical protein